MPREDAKGFWARLQQTVESRDVENRASNVMLVEYTKLKDEIANRSTLQNAIIALNVAAVGTLAGFVFSRGVNTMILLVLTPLSTALGLLWLNHAQTIQSIGDYIRDYLWPRLIEWQSEPGKPDSYEQVVVETSLLDRSSYVVPFLVVFIGPAFASVIVVVHSVRGAEAWVLWSLDVVVAIFCFSMWIYFLRSSARRGLGAPG